MRPVAGAPLSGARVTDGALIRESCRGGGPPLWELCLFRQQDLGPCMVYLWSIYGLSMVYPMVYPMVYLWSISVFRTFLALRTC